MIFGEDSELEELSEEESNTKRPFILTPLEYFLRYFSHQFLQMLPSTRVLLKIGIEMQLSSSDMKKVFGMNLILGTISYPRLRMYWQLGMSLDVITKTMARDKFLEICNCLHLVATQHPPPQHSESKLWKVQPVLDAVQHEKLYTMRTENLYFDYSQWTDYTPQLDRTLGLGPAIILRLQETVPRGSVLYLTTVPLLRKLLSNIMFTTGTIMANLLRNVISPHDVRMKRGNVAKQTTDDDDDFTALLFTSTTNTWEGRIFESIGGTVQNFNNNQVMDSDGNFVFLGHNSCKCLDGISLGQ
ncbi:hypothetical protein PR048_015685 [Dryococelus australis]|uniref:PiggyBac transposable element-derived protein domain-containing protein n=1 Tax=Dryococelus australis TaxID=614101 RepID=A0ABQ9HHL6_9NEOP|nr:hypothetical protein PR048_015685 [Dryococelus australis]